MPTDIPPTVEQIGAFLKDELDLKFRIDIEVDSTINADEQQEKASRTEFITAMSQFISTWGPIVQAQPAMAPLAGELLLFGVRAFRTARSLEGVIEQMVTKMEQEAAQPKQPPVDPVEQAKLAIVQAQGQNDQQAHAAKMQQSDQAHQQALQAAREKHQQEMDNVRQQADITTQKTRAEAFKDHVAAFRDHQAHAHNMALKGAEIEGAALQHRATQIAADNDQARQHADAQETSKLKRTDAEHALAVRGTEAAANVEVRAKDDERKTKSASADDERKAKAAKATAAATGGDKVEGAKDDAMQAVKALADQVNSKHEELSKMIKAPKKIKIGARDPKTNRITEAVVE
jgi:hypothetical protein